MMRANATSEDRCRQLAVTLLALAVAMVLFAAVSVPAVAGTSHETGTSGEIGLDLSDTEPGSEDVNHIWELQLGETEDDDDIDKIVLDYTDTGVEIDDEASEDDLSTSIDDFDAGNLDVVDEEVTIDIDGADIDSDDTVEMVLDGIFTNPVNAGAYDVTIQLIDDEGETVSETTTFSVGADLTVESLVLSDTTPGADDVTYDLGLTVSDEYAPLEQIAVDFGEEATDDGIDTDRLDDATVTVMDETVAASIEQSGDNLVELAIEDEETELEPGMDFSVELDGVSNPDGTHSPYEMSASLRADDTEITRPGTTEYHVYTDGTLIDSCTTIDEPGEYLLTDDIAGEDGCVSIESDDVVFDGQGHAISAADSGDESGLSVTNAENVTVTDVSVEGWDSLGRGIMIDGSQDVTVSDVVAENNTFGIQFDNTDEFTLEHSHVQTNDRFGIQVLGSTDGLIHNITAVNNTQANGFSSVIVRGIDGISSDIHLEDVYVEGSQDEGTGIRLGGGVEGVTADALTAIENDGVGVSVPSDNVEIGTVTAEENEWDFEADATVDVDGIDIGDSTHPETMLSFTASDVRLRSADSPPDNPDAADIGRYVALEETSDTAYLNSQIQYEEDDLNGIEPEELSLWQHDGEQWGEIVASDVDLDEQAVTHNLTDLTAADTVGIFESATDETGFVDIEQPVFEEQEIFDVTFDFDGTQTEEVSIHIENRDTEEDFIFNQTEPGTEEVPAAEIGGIEQGDEIIATIYETPDLVTLLSDDTAIVEDSGATVSIEEPVFETQDTVSVDVGFDEEILGDEAYLVFRNDYTEEFSEPVSSGEHTIELEGGLDADQSLTATLYETPDQATLLDDDETSVEPIDAVVDVLVSPPGEGSFADDETVKIAVGAIDQQPAQPEPLAETELTVEVEGSGLPEQTVVTDENGFGAIEIDLEEVEGNAGGTYGVSVESKELDARAETQFDVGPVVDIVNRDLGTVFVDQEMTASALVRNGEFGVENESVDVRVTDPDDQTALETTETTDEDGFVNVSFVPEQKGEYSLAVEVDGGDDFGLVEDSITPYATNISVATDEDIRRGAAGEEAVYGGYLQSSDGQVANTEMSVTFVGSDEKLLQSKNTTTDENGFFLVEYDVPPAEERESGFLGELGLIGVEIEVNNTQIPAFETIFAPPQQMEADESQALDLEFDRGQYAPGETGVELEVSATDTDGDPVTDEEVEIFVSAERDHSEPQTDNTVPVFTTTATTDNDGMATVTLDLPEQLPEGVNLVAEGTLKSGDLADGYAGAQLREIDIPFPSPENQELTPGEEETLTTEVTRTATDDGVEGVPLQLAGLKAVHTVDTWETTQEQTDEQGVASTTITVPEDIGPNEPFNLIHRYNGVGPNDPFSLLFQQGDPSQTWEPLYDHPGTLELSTDRDSVTDTSDSLYATPGETIEATFTTDVETTGILFTQSGEHHRSFGTEITAGEPTELTIPNTTSPGDTVGLGAWTAHDDSFHTGQSIVEVVEQHPALFEITTDEDQSTLDVEAGEEIEVEGTVENIGESTATKNISFAFDGNVQVTEPVTLEPGESIDVVFTNEVDAEDDGSTVELLTEDDESQSTITVEEIESAAFDVSIDESASTLAVEEGESIEVEGTVSNTGDVDDTQDIELRIGPNLRDSTTVSLDGDETTSVSLSHEPSTAVDGSTLTLSSDDDEESTTVSVDEPPEPDDPAVFQAAFDTVPEAVTAGEPVTIEYSVENTGDLDGTQTVSSSVDGEPITEREYDLAGGQSASGEGTYIPETPGTIEAELETADETVTETVSVTPRPTGEISLTEQITTEHETVPVDLSFEETPDGDATVVIENERSGEQTTTTVSEQTSTEADIGDLEAGDTVTATLYETDELTNALDSDSAGVSTPDIELDQSRLDFETVTVGANETESLTVENLGDTPVSIDSVTLVGDENDQFDVETELGSIDPDESEPIDVRYEPADVEPAAVTLELAGETGTLASAPVEGEGVPPGVTVDPDTVELDSVTVGNQQTETLTVENQESVPVDLDIETATDETEQFDIETTSLSLAPDESETVEIEYEPETVGETNATVEVGDSTGTLTSASLSGEGVEPSVDIDPDSVDFGEVEVGADGNVTDTVTITTDVDGDIDLEASEIVGDSDAFSVEETRQTVSSDEQLQQEITFTPEQSGEHSAELFITDETGLLENRVSLNGTGVAGELDVGPTSVSFRDIEGEQTATETVTVENTGGAELTVTRAELEESPGDFTLADGDDDEFTLSPEESRELTIEFEPETEGVQSTYLFVESDAPTDANRVISVTSGDVELDVTVDEQNRATTSAVVQNVSSDAPAEVDLPSPVEDEEFEADSVSVTPTEETDLNLSVTSSGQSLDTTPAGQEGFEPNTGRAGNVSAETDLDDADIEEVDMTTRVDKAQLEAWDSDAESVSMYRFDETNEVWEEQETEIVEEDGNEVVLRASADSFSEWTAAAARPNFEISQADVDVDVATIDEAVAVDVFVENTGGTEGTYVADLLLDGEVVETKESVIASGGQTLFDFEPSFEDPGVYEVQVNEEQITELEIEDQEEETTDDVTEQEQTEEDTDDDDDDGTPWLPIGAVALLVLIGAGLGGWYYRKN